jgi:hypothetical protein
MTKTSAATGLSLGQLLEQQPPAPPPSLVEPGLMPAQGILFVGGEPKVGESLLVANLALSLAAGDSARLLTRPGTHAFSHTRIRFTKSLPRFLIRVHGCFVHTF